MPLQTKVSDEIYKIMEKIISESDESYSIVRHLEYAMIEAKELENREEIE